MTRVIPFVKKNKNNNAATMMMQPMEMEDLGLGAIPDLLFAEQLDVVPPQEDDDDNIGINYPEEDEEERKRKSELEEEETGSGHNNVHLEKNPLFQDLEEFNKTWIKQEKYQEQQQQQQQLVFQDAPAQNIKDRKRKSLGMKATATANILSQAIQETDLETFIADNDVFINQLSPAASDGSGGADDDEDNTQNLIEEMEHFLAQHEMRNIGGGGANSTRQTSAAVVAEPADASALTADESKQAEDILDALISGNISFDGIETDMADADASYTTNTADAEEGNNSTLPADDSGFLSNISNISEVMTDDGQKVVIIIANDMTGGDDQQQKLTAQPRQQQQSPEETVPETTIQDQQEDDSDPEWSPYSPAATAARTTATKEVKKRGRKPASVQVGRVEKKASNKRGPYKRSTVASIRDKKERKKMQNVEAARRYRDKKKVEANTIGEEEGQMTRKNKKLKSKVAEMEAEVKTLKKLMAELGLVK